ncbi:hypothetical protein BDZ89DRAFT_276705 [Hymenopellis radicata]|nr:hypothetical protein BDZ89DRAFT_276705 [Hymenopellis radicata]
MFLNFARLVDSLHLLFAIVWSFARYTRFIAVALADSVLRKMEGLRFRYRRRWLLVLPPGMQPRFQYRGNVKDCADL